MAKRRSTSQAIVVRENIRPQAPIIRINTPRAPAAKKKRGGRRRSGGASSTSLTRLGTIGGAGFLVGQLEKSSMWASVPALPFLGKKGTALLVLHYGKFGGSWGHDAQIALAALCGYELGKDGSISGAEGI